MKALNGTVILFMALASLSVAACRSADEETGMPAMLKTRFQTEMKTK